EQATATAIVAPSPGEARSARVVKTTTSPMLASSQSPEIRAHELLLPQPRAAPASAAPASAAPANAAPANAAPANAAALVSTSKLLSSGALLDLGPKSVTSGAPLNLWQEALQEIPRAADKVSIATVTLQDGRSADAIVRTN